MSAATGLSLDRLRQDLQTYARLAEVRYEPAVVDRMLEALPELWANAPVGVRTTTHPVAERELNVRVTFPGEPSGILARLREAGLLDGAGTPMLQLLTEVSAAMPVFSGVDLAVGRGVQKLWLMFPEVISVERMLAFPAIPDSARAAAAHLTDYGGDIAIVAVDFIAQTMNLYSRVFEPGSLTAPQIATILTDLDFVPATDEELTILAPNTFNIYRTFSWTSPHMSRICFPVRYDRPTFPTHLNPLLHQFVSAAPFANPYAPNGFVFYTAYGPTDRYYKVQAEYSPAQNPTNFPGRTEPRRATN